MRRRSFVIIASPKRIIADDIGSGVAVTALTVPATVARAAPAGELQAPFEQNDSKTAPTGPLLISIVPPALVSPAVGTGPTAVKKNAIARFPV